MKSPSSAKKLSFVLYEDQHAPRYFNISKVKLRFLFYVLPSLTVISIALVVGMSVYFEQLQELARRKEPAIIKDLKTQKEKLAVENKDLYDEQLRLQKKLNEGIENPSGLNFLSLFQQSSGRKDLSASPKMSIDEVSADIAGNKIKFNFKILNMTKNNTRLTGYLFVLMQSGSELVVWPTQSLDSQSMQASFADGQYFATSRFRPVNAVFNNTNAKNALFKIIVFSRTGDLIFKQLVSKALN